MAAFIIISADNRLHYLVDGIENSLPLNPDVPTKISTGKITKSEKGEYIYKYKIPGEGIIGEEAKSFSDLLCNQMAAFRLAYTMASDEIVNIFFLENPLTETELEESEIWLQDFDKLYNNGKGRETNFCLFRVIFTYNQENPSDVSCQIEKKALDRLIDKHIKNVLFNAERGETFERYLFYINNQKQDSAALCLRKDEHDLKMPRILIDFMMLVSNSSDKYNIIAAINPALVTTRCFSLGYAESMYYYPDVERYYIHADNRDMHLKFLKSDDEVIDEEGEKAMDIEKFPFGLALRQKRLNEIYADVPFTENITNYPQSADSKIDKCLVGLRDLIEHERQHEIESFENTIEIRSIKSTLENYEQKIESAEPVDGESVEDFQNRLNQLRIGKENTIKALEKQKQGFEPECPVYTDRNEIYDELCTTDDEEKEALLNSKSAQYVKLVNFLKTKKFREYLEKAKALENENAVYEQEVYSQADTGEIINNRGCLPSLFLFWKKSNQEENESNQKENKSDSVMPNNAKSKDFIVCIQKQLELKKKFVSFKEEVSAIESIYKEEKEYCEKFKLTTHTNMYCPLINLDRLIKSHTESSEARLQESINSWRLKEDPRKEKLVEMVKTEAQKHTKNNYSFLDWNHPIPFIQEISNLPLICNELHKRAAPLVNYNLVTETNEDKIFRCFFSDRPHFKDELDRIRPQLDRANEVSASMSTHIVSKICMFQFLPMDEDVLNNLV